MPENLYATARRKLFNDGRHLYGGRAMGSAERSARDLARRARVAGRDSAPQSGSATDATGVRGNHRGFQDYGGARSISTATHTDDGRRIRHAASNVMKTPKRAFRQKLAHNQPYASRSTALAADARTRTAGKNTGGSTMPSNRGYPYNQPWHPASNSGSSTDVDSQPDVLSGAQSNLAGLREKLSGDSKNFGSRAWGAARMVSNNMREAARESNMSPNSLAALQMKGNALSRSAGEISRAHAGLIDNNRRLELSATGMEADMAAQNEQIKIARAREARAAEMDAFQRYLAEEQNMRANYASPVWRRLQRGGQI